MDFPSGSPYCGIEFWKFPIMDLKQQLVETPLDFGQHYAVLSLDWMSILIDTIENTPEGQAFIANCSRWNDAVHEKDPRPVIIFTSLFLSDPSQPELHQHKRAPFTRLVRNYHTFAKNTPEVKIDPRFLVDERDIVIQKTRWYAGAGNALEQILKSQNIDTVIIVCASPWPLLRMDLTFASVVWFESLRCCDKYYLSLIRQGL